MIWDKISFNLYSKNLYSESFNFFEDLMSFSRAFHLPIHNVIRTNSKLNIDTKKSCGGSF